MLESLFNAFSRAAAWVLGKREEEAAKQHAENAAEAEREVTAAEKAEREKKP